MSPNHPPSSQRANCIGFEPAKKSSSVRCPHLKMAPIQKKMDDKPEADDPTEAPAFKRVVRHFLETPPKRQSDKPPSTSTGKTKKPATHSRGA